MFWNRGLQINLLFLIVNCKKWACQQSSASRETTISSEEIISPLGAHRYMKVSNGYIDKNLEASMHLSNSNECVKTTLSTIPE